MDTLCDGKRDWKDTLKLRLEFLTSGGFLPYFLMVLPMLILYLVFSLFPTAFSVFFSFTDFNGVDLNFDFVGLKNYKIMISDASFFTTIKNTVIFAVAVTIVQNILGLLTALGLNQPIKSRNILRTLIFAPALISAVIVSFAWTYIYDANGVINAILSFLGLGSLTRTWLGEPDLALGCVILAHVWRFIGYTAVIYLANLQSISSEMLEAAKIDGAKGKESFRYIIFPMLAPSTTINVTLAFIGSLKVFDTIYTMTGGGPGDSTEVVATYIVRLMGKNYNGYACTIAVMLTVIVIALNGFLFKFLRSREEM